MAYLKKKKYKKTEDSLLILPCIVSLFIYSYMRNITLTIISFVCLLAIIIGIKMFFKSIRNKKLLASGIYSIDKMSGEQFEEYMLAYFKSQGYSGYLTRTTGDFGADLVIEKDGIKTVVQAKRWNNKVGIDAIQQVIGAIKHYGASKGMVVSNSYFTSPALKLAQSNDIVTWDRNYIISNMKKITDKNDNPESNDSICPRCGNKLNLRNSKYGSFWGCSDYPRCKYTQKI